MEKSHQYPSDDSSTVIRIDKLNKWFGTFHVLRDLSLSVKQGEKIVICGPSGSGKSTLIRCINFLEEHQEGKIIVDGIELTGDLKNIDAVRREVGMVFQSFNLFPHLTVIENCTSRQFGFEKHRRRKQKNSQWNISNGSKFRNKLINIQANYQVDSSKGSR